MLYDTDTPLHTLPRVGNRLLISPLGSANALQPDLQPSLVHHREHTGQALIFLTDQIADSTALVPVGHDTGRTAVDAQFVLGRDRIDVVALAQRSISIHQVLRHQE